MASQFKFKMVFVGGYVHARAVLVEVKGGTASSELELQVVMNYLGWLLGTKLRSSVRTVDALNQGP